MFDHFRRKFFGLLSVLMLCMALPSLAGAWVTVKGDGDRWMKFGAGLRASYQTTSDSSLDARGGDIALEDMRLYTLTQVHKNIVFEFNTEVRSKADNADSDYTDNSFHDIFVLIYVVYMKVQHPYSKQ